MNSWMIDIHIIVSWFIHIAVCVTFVSVAGIAALWACKSMSAPVRHTLALGILLAVVLLPVFTAAYQWNFVANGALNQPWVSSVTLPSEPPAVSTENPIAPKPMPQGAGPTLHFSWRFTLSCITVLVWVGGSLWLLLRTAGGIWRQRALLRAAERVTDEDSAELFSRIVQRLGIRRKVAFRTLEQAPWPFTVGLFRPHVIVPGRLLRESSMRQLEALLNHELAHVYRLDYGVSVIQQAVAIAYWWNSGLTYLTQTIEGAREKICDDFVLAHFGEGKTLAKYLIHYLEKAPSTSIHLVLAVDRFCENRYSFRCFSKATDSWRNRDEQEV